MASRWDFFGISFLGIGIKISKSGKNRDLKVSKNPESQNAENPGNRFLGYPKLSQDWRLILCLYSFSTFTRSPWFEICWIPGMWIFCSRDLNLRDSCFSVDQRLWYIISLILYFIRISCSLTGQYARKNGSRLLSWRQEILYPIIPQYNVAHRYSF